MKPLEISASCIRCKQAIDVNRLEQTCPSCQTSFDNFDPSEAKEILTKQIQKSGEYLLNMGNLRLKVLTPQGYFGTEDSPADEGIFITFTELQFTPFQASAKLRDLK